MKPSRLKSTIFVLVVVVALAGGWFAWKWLEPAEDMQDFAWSNGRIEATEVNLATKLGGRLMEVFAEEGDTVQKGQALAKMDTRTLEADLRQAEAAVRQMEHKVAQAQSLVSSRSNEIKAAKALVSQRRSQEALSSKEAGRTAELFKQDVISRQAMDIDQTAKKTNSALLDAAQAQLQAALAAYDSAQSGVMEAQAGVEAARAQVETIQSNIDDSSLASPIDGRVLYRLAEPGEVLAAGGNVLTLLDITNVYMTFFLPTDEAGKVSIGAEARIVLDARKDISIPAKIIFVSPEAQFTPKSVETQTEREKLMFRVKARISPELLRAYAAQVKTGLPGLAYVRLVSDAQWPSVVPPLFQGNTAAQ